MAPPTIVLAGDAVDDETQLDGARHLTVELRDPAAAWLATLHFIIARDGAPREAELLLDGPDGPWSGTLVAVEAFDSEGPLHLRARFAASEPGDPGLTLDLRQDAEAGAYQARIGPAADA